mmetsp:Transcript_26502/g.55284  ORF Transcript_26502/g.55284 Transcript_26502/m.55284 type:complete len:201 (-) Transcript_26502:1403-2005(-)
MKTRPWCNPWRKRTKCDALNTEVDNYLFFRAWNDDDGLTGMVLPLSKENIGLDGGIDGGDSCCWKMTVSKNRNDCDDDAASPTSIGNADHVHVRARDRGCDRVHEGPDNADHVGARNNAHLEVEKAISHQSHRHCLLVHLHRSSRRILRRAVHNSYFEEAANRTSLRGTATCYCPQGHHCVGFHCHTEDCDCIPHSSWYD